MVRLDASPQHFITKNFKQAEKYKKKKYNDWGDGVCTQWCSVKSQSKAEGPKTRSLNVQEQEKTEVSASEEEANSPFLHFFVLFGPSKDCTITTHTGKGGLLYTVYRFKCYCPLEAPSQTHPEMIFTSIISSLIPVKLTHKIKHHNSLFYLLNKHINS